jgi:uncharacterized membrane protein YeaQ/YmgE (transglycosylase-associated protein family)
MGILGWIVTGFVAGGLARIVTRSEKRGCLGTVVVGVLGGLLGGALFSAAGEQGIDDFSWWSILVAFIGACGLLLVLQAVGGRRERQDT